METELYLQVYKSIVLKRCIIRFMREDHDKEGEMGIRSSFSFDRAVNMNSKWLCRNGHLGVFITKFERQLSLDGSRLDVNEQMVNDICWSVNSIWMFNRVYSTIKQEMDAIAAYSFNPFLNLCLNPNIRSNERLEIISIVRRCTIINNKEENKKKECNNNNSEEEDNGVKWRVSSFKMVETLNNRDYQLLDYILKNGLEERGFLTKALEMGDSKMANMILDHQATWSPEEKVAKSEMYGYIVRDDDLKSMKLLGKSGDVNLFKRILGEKDPSKYTNDLLLSGACLSGSITAFKYIQEQRNEHAEKMNPSFPFTNVISSYLVESSIIGGNYKLFQLVTKDFTPQDLYSHLLKACELGTCPEIVMDIYERAIEGTVHYEKVNKENLLSMACKSGNVNIVKYILRKTNRQLTKRELDFAATNGHVEVLNLASNPKVLLSNKTLSTAALNGHVGVVKYYFACAAEMKKDLTQIYYSDLTEIKTIPSRISKLPQYEQRAILPLGIAILKGHLKIVKLICKNIKFNYIDNVDITLCCEMGHIEILKYFISTKKIDRLPNYLTTAARNGYFDIVTLLIELKSHYLISKDAIDAAAKNGYMAIVKYLLDNNCVGTTKAMDDAAEGGYLSIVKLLHYQGRKGCTEQALSNAIINNDLEMVKFLHNNRTEGASKNAMDHAYEHGYKEVLDVLLPTMVEPIKPQLGRPLDRYKFSVNTLEVACRNGDLDMIRYWVIRNPLDTTVVAIENAVEFGHIDALECIRVNGGNIKMGQSMIFKVLENVISSHDEKMLNYILDNCLNKDIKEKTKQTSRLVLPLQRAIRQCVKRKTVPQILKKLIKHSSIGCHLDLAEIKKLAIDSGNQDIIDFLG